MSINLFKNKKCFITGATGGLGKQLSLSLAKNGCDLFLTARNQKQLKLLKDIILSAYPNIKVEFQSGDLSNIQDIENIILTAKKLYPNIDILINCAGIFPVKLLTKTSLEDFESCFNVNIRAPFIFTQEFSKKMVKNKWGRIVNIGSSSSYAGFAETSIYCSSKHALLGFSRAINEELKSCGVRTFCISPGSIKTKMGKKVKNQNFNTFMDPSEVADLIIYLIKSDNSISTPEIKLERTRKE